MQLIASASAAEPQQAVASATGQPPQEAYSVSAEKMMMENLMLLGLLFFVFYFLLIRPQQRRLKAHREMLKGLQKGDRVVTAGGLIGTLVKFEGDDVAVLEVAQGMKVRVGKSFISEVRPRGNQGDIANDN